MLKPEHTEERLTRRTGLSVINHMEDELSLPQKIIVLSKHQGQTVVFRLVNENDEVYKEMAEVIHFSISDAIDDWLLRHVSVDGERTRWRRVLSLC